MSSFGARRTLIAGLVALSVGLTACGASNFDRADAISALQTAGLTTPQATCIADTLIERGQLDSADPRIAAGDEDRQNLSSANERCVNTDVLETLEADVEIIAADTTSTLGEAVVMGGGAEAEEAEETAAEPQPEPFNPEVIRQDAIARLVGLGRSEANARCVVDTLLSQGATDAVISLDLGLGLDIREASAFASCS